MKKVITTIVLALSIGQAFADNKTASNKATATLANSCQFSTSNVVFGNYDPNATDHLQSSQNLNLKCTKGTAYRIWTYAASSLTLANYGAVAIMTSASSTDKLYYQIYQSWYTPARWNDDNNYDPETYRGTGDGAWQSISFLYRVIKNQYVAPANYSATQTMNVTF